MEKNPTEEQARLFKINALVDARCAVLSHEVVSDSWQPHGRQPHAWDLPGSSVHGDFPGKNTRVAMPSSGESSPPRDLTQVSHIAGRFFYWRATKETQEYWRGLPYPPLGETSPPRDWTCLSWGSYIAGRFFTAKPPGKPRHHWMPNPRWTPNLNWTVTPGCFRPAWHWKPHVEALTPKTEPSVYWCLHSQTQNQTPSHSFVGNPWC